MNRVGRVSQYFPIITAQNFFRVLVSCEGETASLRKEEWKKKVEADVGVVH